MLKVSSDLIKSCKIRNVPIRLLSATVELKPDERIQSFRTLEIDPTNHSADHLGLFYNIPAPDKSVLFQHGGLPKTYDLNTKTFAETAIMVRRPAIDIINCLKSIDYSRPAIRFILYGPKGSGKSLSLAHVLHYAYKNQYLIVHVPWVGNWTRRPKDVSNSETKEGFFDLNIDAAAWLLHFKTQNAEMLKKPELKLSREIQWSKRETTPQDAPLSELIDHGINRIRFASNCVNVLTEEIKKLSDEGLIRTLVSVDGVNAFFYQKTRIFGERKVVRPPNKVTLIQAFVELTKFNWKNAAIVCTVDEICVGEDDQQSWTPKYLLGKEGFEHFDPFVPVEVTGYSEKEHRSIMEYFRDRKWIKPYPGIDEELYYLSNGNPYRLLELCKSY